MVRTQNTKVSLVSIFLAYFLVGVTAFGFAILQKLKILVRKKQWLSEKELDEGLALVQLYPGPIMVNLNTYVGYKLRGLPGALASTIGFITPTTILMLILSYVYFSFGKMSWVRPVFTGLEALVVGVLLNVVLDFGKRGIQNKVQAAIAVLAFAALILNFNVVFLVLLSLAVGALLIRPKEGDNKQTTRQKQGNVQNYKTTTESNKEGSVSIKKNIPGTAILNHSAWWQRWMGIGLALLFLLGGVGIALSLTSSVGKSSLSFFKIGSVAFGNGLTILPLIQADVVEKFHWLTLNQFVDGIALSQITPGPFLVIATFVGFKLGGVWAALLTTFAMFSPSFVLTLIFTELFSHVHNLRVVRGALAGVLAAFVGLLAAMLLQLGGVISHSHAGLIFAAAAFAGVRFFKLDILIVFGGGLVLWIGLYLLGVPL